MGHVRVLDRRARPFVTTAGLMLAASAGIAAPATAQEAVGALERPAPVSAYRGWSAWSEYDAANGRFHLVRRRNGVTARVPVPPRRVPFDVDLGPDARGDVSAVYSRCRVEPTSGEPATRRWAVGTPQWSTGRGCDLHRFTFATGRETSIAGANTRRASEFLPTIWKGRVAFARVYTSRRGTSDRRAHLYHRSIAGGGASAGLPDPPRGEPGRVEPGPSAMDLVGRRLALAWETYREGPVSEIDLLTIGAGRRLVERVGSGEIQTVNLVSAGIRGGWVHYGEGGYGDLTYGQLRRHGIRTGRHETAVVSADRTLLATAPSAGGAYALISGGVQAGCFGAVVAEPGVLRAPCPLTRMVAVDWRRHVPLRFPLR